MVKGVILAFRRASAMRDVVAVIFTARNTLLAIHRNIAST
jgi:hypothetical protein